MLNKRCWFIWVIEQRGDGRYKRKRNICTSTDLQLVERVGSVLQKDLDNALVAPSARQAQRSVVVIGRGAVHFGAALQQERHGGEVAGPGRLHQRRPPALALVLQLGAVLQQQVSDLSVTVLAGVGQGSVTGRSLGVHLGAGLQEVPVGILGLVING